MKKGERYLKKIWGGRRDAKRQGRTGRMGEKCEMDVRTGKRRVVRG